MKDEYNREWFKQFNIVVNALDNRQVSDAKIMYKTKRPIDGASKILTYAILTVRCLLLLLLVTNNMYLTESYTTYNRDAVASRHDVTDTELCLLQARNHVNRMCLAADVPLVESGTAGYLGQVIKRVTCHVSLIYQMSPR